MSPKGKKSSSVLWYFCESCGCLLSQKDLQLHVSNACPQGTEEWTNGFIKDETLYSFLEETNSSDVANVTNDVVLLSQSAMQLCHLVIGDHAVVTTGNYSEVKTVWPTQEGALTSVFLTKKGLEASWGLSCGPVVVSSLPSVPVPASEVVLYVTKPNDSPDNVEHFLNHVKHEFMGKVLYVGIKMSINFYGKRIKLMASKVSPVKTCRETDDDVAQKLGSLSLDGSSATAKFFKAIESTKWSLPDTREADEGRNEFSLSLENFGGYKEIVKDLKESMSYSLNRTEHQRKNMKPSLGVLLHGINGTGKSHLAQALAFDSGVHVVNIQSGDLFSKYYGETEARLRASFKEARSRAPSIVLLDDVDTLCPKRGGSDQERRVVSTLLTLLDSLARENVVVLATTSQAHLLDLALRRPGRLDREIEIPVPSPADREDILLSILKSCGCANQLSAATVRGVANAAHGFVGADMGALVAQSQLHAVRCGTSGLASADVEWALTQVKPSAMREVYVEVPNVRWSDIGGQEELKLKLQQAVEWPLRHPQAFARLGITPPKGVLMYGPPGCSKTMVAKALATESKLNFISIKGSELFSKWVGESERAVRAVFKRARSVAPSVVFLDELDALAGERGNSGENGSGGASVQERVLAQLLTEMDGVEPLGNVTIVAATNRPDRIDKALLRPGRLDRLVYVPLPDLQTRTQILQLQFRKTPTAACVDVGRLAALTENYSGAEVIAVCHEAALTALEEDGDACRVRWTHFEHALTLVTPRTPDSWLALYEKYRT